MKNIYRRRAPLQKKKKIGKGTQIHIYCLQSPHVGFSFNEKEEIHNHQKTKPELMM